MYVVDHTLPYLILGLPELSKFNLTIDCSHLKIKQNGNIVNKINKYKNEQKYSLHINEETYVTPAHSQISEDQNVLPQIVIENRSPVTLAFKRDEGKKTRLCIDFRKLNALCKADSEPLPIMDSLLDKLARAKFFSTLDLASGYWHVPIHPKGTEKLAFCTNFGLYEWCRLPFGIKVAPAIFNRLIRRILIKHKIDFAYNYFDDIIVFSSSEKEHGNHLKTIFDICQKENIKLKLSKCVFAQTKINFLRYEIEEGKITPNNTNIDNIKKLKPPNNVKELQRFLGSINVYHKFIPEYADLRYPLNMLLKKDAKFNWTDECQNAFEKLKESLITKPILHLYNPDLTYPVFVVASQKSVGAVMKQLMSQMCYSQLLTILEP
ncbi:retrovirus-related Pol polyprotein from transposon 17.6 [Trichonephila clavipes]|nr:retrovirus-related Pol polyprotein from transposon 17.6 [Trichonephila clavipes]